MILTQLKQELQIILAGFPAYKIAATYGMRKLVEFGIVAKGYKGYFVDYDHQ
jgi:hypothetical protein